MSSNRKLNLDEGSTKGANLELFDEEGIEEPRSGTPESPSPMIPDVKTSNGQPKSILYQFKQNFGISLMGIILVGSNLNRLSRLLTEPLDSHIITKALVTISLFIEAVLVSSALIMSSYNINNRQHVIKANNFNNLILYCTFVLIVLKVALISFEL